MDIITIAAAIETLHKLTAFIIGASEILDSEIYPRELKVKLDSVLIKADQPVDPRDQNLISEFRQLYELHQSLYATIVEDLSIYYDIRHRPDLLVSPLKEKYELFEKISDPLYWFAENLKSKPWGRILQNKTLGDMYAAYTVTTSSIKEDNKDKQLLLSDTSLCPEGIDAFCICVRIHLLVWKEVFKSPITLYSTPWQAYTEIGIHFGKSPKTIRDYYAISLEYTYSTYSTYSTNSTKKILKGKRKKQMEKVKQWLTNEGYHSIANTIMV